MLPFSNLLFICARYGQGMIIATHISDTVKHFVKPRETIADFLNCLFPDFTIPDCVQIKLDDFSEDLLRLRLTFPATAKRRGDRDLFVYDLYENFAYLFGKGFYDTNNDPQFESMVWYVTKKQRIARRMAIWIASQE
jgi:hypothetical protein